jgi:hypothetical protein
MAYEEGFRRIKFVARIVLVLGLALVAIGAVGAAVSNLRWMIPAILGIYVSIFAGILWTAAWIIEGFIRGPRIPQQ